jgi:hypothetical protein
VSVLASALIDLSYWALSIIAVALAWLTRYWIGFAFLQSLVLLCLLYLAVVRIPLVLNWSRNLYGSVFMRVFFFQLFAIFTYALCFFSHGALAGKFESYWDAVYFSAITWTTVGYGDITPVGSIRLVTSLEALTGISTIPVLASVIWLYCDSRLRSKTQEEQGVERYQLQTDRAFGYFVEVENERTLAEQAKRDLIKLRPCSCEASRPQIVKYFDVVGRLTPLPRFQVVCRSCGAFSKPRLNAYLSAWTWNERKHWRSPTTRPGA